MLVCIRPWTLTVGSAHMVGVLATPTDFQLKEFVTLSVCTIYILFVSLEFLSDEYDSAPARVCHFSSGDDLLP